MKHLIALTILTTFSLSSFAGPIRPKTMTCDEINELLESEGSIYVTYGLLGITRGTMYADSRVAYDNCPSQVVKRPNLRAKDGSCLAGYVCAQAPVRY